MPPLEFINTFLPAPTQGAGRKNPRYDPTTFRQFLGTRKPELRYQRWVDALESSCGRTVNQVDTHKLPIFNEDGKEFGPEVCVYLGRRDKGFEPPNFLDIRKVEMSIHFSLDCDPFIDGRSDTFEHTGRQQRALLSKMALAALSQLSAQARTHVFSLLVCQKFVRLLRWDRSGVIVTQRIPLAESGHLVATFFHRLQFASPCARGIDETLSTPKLSETQEQLIRETLEVGPEVPLLQVTISGRRFIYANTAIFQTHFARSTHCFRAYNLDAKRGEDRRVIIKDTWRIVEPNGSTEFEKYQKLRRAGVQNIAKIWCGEDVFRDLRTGSALHHRTRTQDYQKARWKPRECNFGLRTYRHYRHAIEEMDGDLTACRTMKDVVIALRDASQAQAEAYEKGQIIHMDCSFCNVMVKYEGDQVRGYLIDWDMSHDLESTNLERPSGRAGQWPFMAARVLRKEFSFNSWKQDHMDDVEGFFHDLIYILVFYTTLFTQPSLISQMKDYFFEKEGQPYEYGGTTKINFLRKQGSQLCDHIPCPRLKEVIQKLSKILYARYFHIDPLFERHKYKEANEQSYQMYCDPYWMPNLLTKMLEETGWLEIELLDAPNDPDEKNEFKEGVDWEKVALEMKERERDREGSRKKRKLR